MKMSERINYDPAEQVVWIDLSNLTLTQPVVDELMGALISLARSLPQKVYALICWKDTVVPAKDIEYYGKKSAEALPYFKGFVRYEATNPFSNIAIRSQAVVNNAQGSRANIYPSKHEALQAVRAMLKAPK
jgi:hypothetical protein